MDHESPVSADLVLVALSAPRFRPPPARSRRATRAGPPPVGPVRSTPERTIRISFLGLASFHFHCILGSTQQFLI